MLDLNQVRQLVWPGFLQLNFGERRIITAVINKFKIEKIENKSNATKALSFN